MQRLAALTSTASPNRSRRSKPPAYAPEFLAIVEDTPLTIWTCDADLRVTRILYTDFIEHPEGFVGGTDYDWCSREEGTCSPRSSSAPSIRRPSSESAST